ncbi:FAD-dependent monooxygenase [Actinomadura roseirufa]|uniref:FAD-dependent monooxygenase n=1 Tax=Actinomadura roseirufa TaxID=2094049 RepID=UPI0013F173B2|nr:FAD-dependent monooxygenase [Actinomadura roseirufa]
MDAQVIVVGGGPAGLMLAGELRTAGTEVIVLERLPEPTGQSRGLGFTARTLEVFDQRGLLPRFGPVETSDRGHFGGLPLDFGVVPGAHYGAKNVSQARTEAMLAEWAAETGADLRRGHELTGLRDLGDAVEADVRGPSGAHTLRAAYLVGCDGGRSLVRKAAGFDFPGTDATLEMFLADVRGCGIRPRLIGETVPGGMVMAVSIAEGVDRIIVCERGTPPRRRTGPPPWREVADAWQRLTGEDISHGTPEWVSAFGDATRQATEYRRGRVLLAGDSAHVHLPAGGQGMNTSVQDAVNLGWKLAAEVAGWAPPGLLDTYHSERHPVGRRLLTNTRAQGLLFLSGEEMRPLRDVMTELMAYEEVARHLVGMVSGLEIRYDMGPGDHPLLGLRMPGRELVGAAGKTTTTELLHRGRGVLLDLSGDPALRDLASPWSDRVDIVTARPHGLDPDDPLAGTDAVLIRPDGHVAWAAPDAASAGPVPALRRWAGAPLTAAPLEGAQRGAWSRDGAGPPAEIARLADRAEITDLIGRYTSSLDDGRFDDAWARSIFAEHAAVAFPVGGHEGVGGLADFTARFMGRWERTHHHATDHLVSLDGDSADVRWNMLATHVHPSASRSAEGEAHFQLGARLGGTAVRTPDGWRFERLELRVVWTSGRPAEGVPEPRLDLTGISISQED